MNIIINQQSVILEETTSFSLRIYYSAAAI